MRVTDAMVERLWSAHYDYLAGNREDLRAAMESALADMPDIEAERAAFTVRLTESMHTAHNYRTAAEQRIRELEAALADVPESTRGYVPDQQFLRTQAKQIQAEERIAELEAQLQCVREKCIGGAYATWKEDILDIVGRGP